MSYTLLGADGRPYRSEGKGQWGGHRRTRIYGRLDCPSALRAIARGGYAPHRVFFADEATALAAGYRPCGICCPGRYQSWKAAEHAAPPSNRPGGERRLWHAEGMQSVYEAAGASAGILRLAEAWHARVLADEIVSHAFSHGYHPEHSKRLAAYWSEALGGPLAYSQGYGDETSVVRIHSGNGPHDEMDQRAIRCFDQALTDVGLTTEPLRQVLHDYFAWATTTTMARYHDSADDVPDGLAIPHWSWDGLQD